MNIGEQMPRKKIDISEEEPKTKIPKTKEKKKIIKPKSKETPKRKTVKCSACGEQTAWTSLQGECWECCCARARDKVLYEHVDFEPEEKEVVESVVLKELNKKFLDISAEDSYD
jgi:hypothetical protein